MKTQTLIAICAAAIILAAPHTRAADSPDIAWEKVLLSTAGGQCRDIVKCSEGNCLVAGSTPSHPGALLTLESYNPDGALLWTRYIGDSTAVTAAAAVRTYSDSGLVIAANTEILNSNSYRDIHLIKTDPAGDIQWTTIAYRGYNIDTAHSLEVTADGGFIIVGETRSIGAGRRDCLIVRLDPAGRELWHKAVGGRLHDTANSVCRTPDGNFVVCGTTQSYGHGREDLYLFALDPDGQLLWETALGGPGPDAGAYVTQTPSGLTIFGSTTSPTSGNSDAWMIKTDSHGVIQWDKTFDAGDNEYITSARPCSDGYLLCGRRGRAWSSDAYLLLLDPAGARIWDKTCGGSAGDSACTAVQTGDSYLLLGRTQSYGRYDTFAGYLAKITPRPLRPADLDYDNEVDADDFAIFAASWQASESDPHFNPACDLAKNNRIDTADLTAFTQNWLR